MDLLLGMEIFKTTICWFLCTSEGISILENIALMDVKIPSFLRDVLVQIHQDSDVLPKDKTNRKRRYQRRRRNGKNNHSRSIDIIPRLLEPLLISFKIFR